MKNARRQLDRCSSWSVRLGLTASLAASLIGLSVSLAAPDTPLNPDDPAYLRRQYAWFQSLDPSRQQQLRNLHADYIELEPATRARHERVIKQYNVWLARLPEDDRARVRKAPSAQARLEIIRQLREQEWVNTLPIAFRQEYTPLETEARKQKVQEWRTAEAEREDEWNLALRSWDQFQPGKPPQLFLNENRVLIENYLVNLRENLLDFERRALDEARANADEHGNFFGYALEVVRLSDAHPILPGHVGPKDFNALPDSVREYLARNDKHFRKKANEESREMRRSQGRWPEFAIELTKYCQKNKLELPVPLGDCRKEQMPAEVVQYLEKVLEPQLRKSDAGKADLQVLNQAQGLWPEYPKTIVDLAKKYKLPIPGWTLPGQSQVWDRVRAGKNKIK